MEMILTKQLLGALIKDGYPYFLCKSAPAERANTFKITLKPVKAHPMLHCLPDSYQRYYQISQELLQMAAGLPGLLVVVERDNLLTDNESGPDELVQHMPST